MQYSKFNNEGQIVRDVTSSAQSICFNNLEDGYYNKNDSVNVYLSAILISPAIAACISLSVIWTYHKDIETIANRPSSRASIVATFLTGVYVTIYILAVDSAAVYFYGTKQNEYGAIPNEPYSIQWTFATLVVECVISIVVLAIIFISSYLSTVETTVQLYLQFLNRHVWVMPLFLMIIILGLLFTPIFIVVLFIICLAIAMVSHIYKIFNLNIEERLCSREVCRLSLPSILWHYLPILFLPFLMFPPASLPVGMLYIYFHLNSKNSNMTMIYFLIVPVVFVSAHFLYICAAWLTEPSKTTSVAILAIAIIFILFILHRSVYNFTKEILKTYFGNFGEDSMKTKYILLVCTTIVGALGVLLIAFYISAFFRLPLPTVKLADYLENIIQVILVLLAALISYKFISLQDSDAKKFLKKFNQNYKLRNDSEDVFEKAGSRCGDIASRLVSSKRRKSIG